MRVKRRPDGSIPKPTDSDFSDFVFGALTGIPVSLAGMMGAAMSAAASQDYAAPSEGENNNSSSAGGGYDIGNFGFDSGGGGSSE